jgi:hypothetical protein
MAQMVLGIFTDRDHANMAVDELQSQGYDAEDISIVTRGGVEEVSDNDTGNNVAEGAVSGATTGGVIGGIAGLLIGVGALTIPGIGALLIGGPLAAALGLTGAAATTASGALTGALAGGLVGALVGLGVPEETAKVYEERIKSGGVLVAVATEGDDEAEVKGILEDHHADEIRTVDTR